MICTAHQQDFVYLCCQSEWHFETLCQKCVVPHNEIHNKNKTLPVIKDYSDVKKMVLSKLEKAGIDYEQIIKQIEQEENLFNYPDFQIYQQVLNQKEKILDKINLYFKQFEKIIENQIDQFIISKKQQYQIILEDLKENQKQINENKTNNDLKSIFFKNYDEQIFSFKQKIEEINQMNLNIDLYMNETKIEKIIKSIDKIFFQNKEKSEKDLINLNQQKLNTSKTVDNKPKIKQISKECKKCGNQMNYVSNFQKQLECLYCKTQKFKNM